MRSQPTTRLSRGNRASPHAARQVHNVAAPVLNRVVLRVARQHDHLYARRRPFEQVPHPRTGRGRASRQRLWCSPSANAQPPTRRRTSARPPVGSDFERRTVTTTSSPSLKSTSAQQSAATSLRRRAPWKQQGDESHRRPGRGARRSSGSSSSTHVAPAALTNARSPRPRARVARRRRPPGGPPGW